MDGFQGEESDIVIVSLVRANKKNTMGFNASPQRVNVMTTRARCQQIVFGHIDTMVYGAGDLWFPFLQNQDDNDTIVDEHWQPMKLADRQLQTHPKKTATARESRKKNTARAATWRRSRTAPTSRQ